MNHSWNREAVNQAWLIHQEKSYVGSRRRKYSKRSSTIENQRSVIIWSKQPLSFFYGWTLPRALNFQYAYFSYVVAKFGRKSADH